MVDLATLTGAARVALGPELPALYRDARGHRRRRCCVTAAQLADPLWHMPLWGGYDDELASKVADVNNVSASTFAGSIIGALFLRRFVPPDQDWLHVDLYAWNGKERPGRPVGAEAAGGARALRADRGTVRAGALSPARPRWTCPSSDAPGRSSTSAWVSSRAAPRR